jgi:hypothetical protein
MRSVILDTRGRLQEFHAVPAQIDSSAPAPVASSWSPLFDAAGLDPAAFTPVQPDWTPHSFADQRVAWEGHYAERPETIRVEGASYRGRPVSFMLVGPWTRAARMTPVPRTQLQIVLSIANFIVYFSVLIGAALLARRNVITNRADRRTATRLASWLVIATCVSWVVLNHHTMSVATEADHFFLSLGYGLYLGGTLWVLYLAAEPYARRLWPDGLLGWTRFFAGHLRDPRVGRDILIGCVFGMSTCMVEASRILVLPLLGQPPPQPTLGTNLALLQGAHLLAGMGASWTYGALQTALFCALMFVGLRFVLRRNWAAFAVSIVVLLAIGDSGQAILGGVGINTLFFALLYGIILISLVRFGLLATTVGSIVNAGLTSVPFPAHMSGWAGGPALWTIALMLGLMAFGFYSSRGGQPLFGNFEERT